MMFDEFSQLEHFRQAWDAVQIARPVQYTLFTFGESELPYYLVCEAEPPEKTVSITRGEVRITRPLIITPDNARPELLNFFEDREEELAAEFLIARTAAFSNLRLANQSGPARIVSDSVEEAVARLSRQLDDAEEDRVAILTAPAALAGMAILKYATDRVWQSTPGNLQELRERGFLP
jgi:hypothetical protein